MNRRAAGSGGRRRSAARATGIAAHPLIATRRDVGTVPAALDSCRKVSSPRTAPTTVGALSTAWVAETTRE